MTSQIADQHHAQDRVLPELASWRTRIDESQRQVEHRESRVLDMDPRLLLVLEVLRQRLSAALNEAPVERSSILDDDIEPKQTYLPEIDVGL